MKIIILFLVFLSAIYLPLDAQKNSRETIIQTHVYCDHCEVCETCKSHIETTLYLVKGVKFCSFNFQEKTIRVVFNPKKTTDTDIRIAISECGYDADTIKATKEGLLKLDECCKKK
jgi:copper chaperone CopZ